MQLRQQADYTDDDDEENDVDDDVEYEENHRKKAHMFRGRYNDGEEEAQEDIEDVEERLHTFNNRGSNKKSKIRSQNTYDDSGDDDDKVSVLNEEAEKKSFRASVKNCGKAFHAK